MRTCNKACVINWSINLTDIIFFSLLKWIVAELILLKISLLGYFLKSAHPVAPTIHILFMISNLLSVLRILKIIQVLIKFIKDLLVPYFRGRTRILHKRLQYKPFFCLSKKLGRTEF